MSDRSELVEVLAEKYGSLVAEDIVWTVERGEFGLARHYGLDLSTANTLDHNFIEVALEHARRL